MDFNLTEEQIIFQNSVRNLAENNLSERNLERALSRFLSLRLFSARFLTEF